MKLEVKLEVRRITNKRRFEAYPRTLHISLCVRCARQREITLNNTFRRPPMKLKMENEK